MVEVTEMTYASDLKEWINGIIEKNNLPFLKATVEEIEEKKRADILIYDKSRKVHSIIEVKRPEESPINPIIVKKAKDYTESISDKPRYFATHNVNYLVLWDSITLQRIDQFPITFVSNLQAYTRKEQEIKDNIRKFLYWFKEYLEGKPPQPVDQSIAKILNSFIEGTINETPMIKFLVGIHNSDKRFSENFDRWILDQGWALPANSNELEEKMIALSKQYLCMFVNKIIFYYLLKSKHNLPDMTLPHDIIHNDFHTLLKAFFDIAIKTTRDYQTVFETNFVDSIPLPLETINVLLKIKDYLSSLEYGGLGYDIIGKIFERLTEAEERHNLVSRKFSC